MGKGCCELAEATKALPIVLQLRVGKPGSMIERRCSGRRLLAGIAHDEATRQELGLRHMQVACESLAEPAGESDMVGVHVRANHAMHRLALHKPVEKRFPMRFG